MVGWWGDIYIPGPERSNFRQLVCKRGRLAGRAAVRQMGWDSGPSRSCNGSAPNICTVHMDYYAQYDIRRDQGLDDVLPPCEKQGDGAVHESLVMHHSHEGRS